MSKHNKTNNINENIDHNNNKIIDLEANDDTQKKTINNENKKKNQNKSIHIIQNFATISQRLQQNNKNSNVNININVDNENDNKFLLTLDRQLSYGSSSPLTPSSPARSILKSSPNYIPRKNTPNSIGALSPIFDCSQFNNNHFHKSHSLNDCQYLKKTSSKEEASSLQLSPMTPITPISLNNHNSHVFNYLPAFQLNHSSSPLVHSSNNEKSEINIVNFGSHVDDNIKTHNLINTNLNNHNEENDDSLSVKSPSHSHSISFDKVNIFEFEHCAGNNSCGVPFDGAYSLHFGNMVDSKQATFEDYEKNKHEKWKKRYEKIFQNDKQKLKEVEKNEDFFYTAGREDEFFGALDTKQRIALITQRENDGNNEKTKTDKGENEKVKEEKKELNKIRLSRMKNEIYCQNCKPLSSISFDELKAICLENNLIPDDNHKRKQQFLLQLIMKHFDLKNIDVCCWNKKTCCCMANEINCHNGNDNVDENGNALQCACFKYHKKCLNPNGRYSFQSTQHSDLNSLVNQWNQHYKDATVT